MVKAKIIRGGDFPREMEVLNGVMVRLYGSALGHKISIMFNEDTIFEKGDELEVDITTDTLTDMETRIGI